MLQVIRIYKVLTFENSLWTALKRSETLNHLLLSRYFNPLHYHFLASNFFFSIIYHFKNSSPVVYNVKDFIFDYFHLFLLALALSLSFLFYRFVIEGKNIFLCSLHFFRSSIFISVALLFYGTSKKISPVTVIRKDCWCL